MERDDDGSVQGGGALDECLEDRKESMGIVGIVGTVDRGE